MRSLFTVHAGEYLVGDYIERMFRRVNLWIPARDTGTDLLVSDAQNKSTVSLQVKYSRDFLPTHMSTHLQSSLRACGWWSLVREKIVRSKADLWVFVLKGFQRPTCDFVVIKPPDLLARLDEIHGPQKRFQTYLWVTKNDTCWEARGLTRDDRLAIAQDGFRHRARCFSEYLNSWEPLKALDRT
jgi:hypothetical protein